MLQTTGKRMDGKVWQTQACSGRLLSAPHIPATCLARAGSAHTSNRACYSSPCSLDTRSPLAPRPPPWLSLQGCRHWPNRQGDPPAQTRALPEPPAPGLAPEVAVAAGAVMTVMRAVMVEVQVM